MRQLRHIDPTPAAYSRRTVWTGSDKLVSIEGSAGVTGATPVIWCHGLFGDGPAARQAETFRELRKIAGYGYPVYSADLGGPDTWSSNAAIALVTSLITHLGATYGVATQRVVIAGESMGSLLALNWAWRFPHRVAAVWVRAPLVDPSALHDRRPLDLGASMEAAWAGEGGYATALPTHNPMQAVNTSALRGIADRMRLDYTSDDEITIPEDVGRFLGAMPPLSEAWAWPGTHIDNRAVDGSAVAEWIGRIVDGRTTRPGGPTHG